jgi:hypothetical protein
MTHWTEAAEFIGDRDYGPQGSGLRRSRALGMGGLAARYAPGALAFTLSAALGVYLVYLRPFLHAPAPSQTSPALQASPFGGLAPLSPPSLADAKPATPSVLQQAANLQPETNPFGALVMKGFGSSARFEIAEAPVPVPPPPPAELRSPEDEAAPLPPRRPTVLARLEAPGDEAPSPPTPERVAPKAPSTSGIFEKLFGSAASRGKAEEPALAYASPPPVSVAAPGAGIAGRGAPSSSGGGFGGFLRNLSFGSNPTSRFGDHVAVYDISARAVYLPDGTRLEAHSGLGGARDDPSKVNERMRGPTPPATYALSPREALFHGVAALRLTPVDGSVFGRAGLLAHTYMLGAEGDSNGCVSFRDYDAFLRAYRSGEITKLVVVSRL